MKRVFWQDETKDQNGAVIQEGTALSEKNLNNLEERVEGLTVGQLNMLQYLRQIGRSVANVEGDVITTTLSNTKKFPFNNSDKLIALSKIRDTIDYTVFVELTAKTGGDVGEIKVFDKQLNGFKVKHTGSATSVELKIYIRGGLK